jgi:uncharacterized SAM-binding protein YcdF (DUF218 family)
VRHDGFSGNQAISLSTILPQPHVSLKFFIKPTLVSLGVPPDAVQVEDHSRSTYENARQTAQLLEQQKLQQVLLVTSALHLPRALATFRAAGIDALPAPTDFEVMPQPPHLLRWLPDA